MTFLRKYLFVLLCYLLFGIISHVPFAQENKPTIQRIEIKKSEFCEFQFNTVEISGNSLLGVMAGTLSNKLKKSTLTVSGIQKEDENIYVFIERLSGTYMASFNTKNPKSGNTIQFILPTKKIEYMDVLSGELAVSVRASSKTQPNNTKCKKEILEYDSKSIYSNADPYLVATWGEKIEDPMLSVLVNSKQATSVRSYIESKQYEPKKCKQLEKILETPDKSTVSYDTVCELLITNFNSNNETAVIQLKDGDKSRDPVEFNIRKPY